MSGKNNTNTQEEAKKRKQVIFSVMEEQARKNDWSTLRGLSVASRRNAISVSSSNWKNGGKNTTSYSSCTFYPWQGASSQASGGSGSGTKDKK